MGEKKIMRIVMRFMMIIIDIIMMVIIDDNDDSAPSSELVFKINVTLLELLLIETCLFFIG